LAIKNSVQKQLSPSVRIVADDTYLLNESSFRTQLIKMKAKGPELLYFVAYPQNLSALLRESKELGINSKLVTNSIMYANGQIGSDPIFEETYATVPTYYLDKNKQISFLEKFGTKYPAGNVYIPYDVINLVAANLQDFDKNNFVKNIIEAGRFESDINGVIEINKTTQKANYDLSVVKILPGGEISSE
jgi:ABC-type branched-subunit amino acid transport system substrate-binding protein